MTVWRFCGEFNDWIQDALPGELSWIDEEEARRRYRRHGARLTIVAPVNESTRIAPCYIEVKPGPQPSLKVVRQMSPASGVGVVSSTTSWKAVGAGRLFAEWVQALEYGPYDADLPRALFTATTKLVSHNREDGTGWFSAFESEPPSRTHAERDSIPVEDLYSQEPAWGDWDALVGLHMPGPSVTFSPRASARTRHPGGEPGSEFDAVFAILDAPEDPQTRTMLPDGGIFFPPPESAVIERLREHARTLVPEHRFRTVAHPNGVRDVITRRSAWETALVNRYLECDADQTLAAIARHHGPNGLRGALNLWSRTQIANTPYEVRIAGTFEGERRLIRMDELVETHYPALRLLVLAADRADIARYRELRKRIYRSAPSECNRAGEKLTRAVSKRDGFEDGFALANRPGTRLPTEQVISAALAGQTMRNVDAWFDEHPDHDEVNTRLTVLWEAFKVDFAAQDERREELIERVAESVWEKSRKQDRDWMLVALATAGAPDAKRLKRVRALIRTPAIKRELTLALESLA